MNALFRRLGHPLPYPEFVCPGFLLLAIGSVFGIGAVFLHGNLSLWLLAALMLAAGVTLVMKLRVGTALLIATLVLTLCEGTGRIEWSLGGVIRFGLGLAFLASMVACITAQFQFHRERDIRRPDRLILPPPH